MNVVDKYYLKDNLLGMKIIPEHLPKIDRSLLLSRAIFPFSYEDGLLKLATHKEDNLLENDYIMMLLKEQDPGIKDIRIYLTSFQNVQDAFVKYYNEQPQSGNSANEPDEKSVEEYTTEQTKLVDTIIRKAKDMQASDIHLTPTNNGMIVQFRVFNRLVVPDINVGQKDKKAVTNRIKYLAHIKSEMNKVAQDGSFRADDMEFRVNTMPCGDDVGEKVDIRLFSLNSSLKNLDDIHFPADDLKTLRELIEMPFGIILLSGPTGQGKSTTLYACMRALGPEHFVILSAEDPVEQYIQGAAQSPIRENYKNQELSWNYAKFLRAALRQDPDIIFVGEIRDTETAIAAVQASQTGHLVFSTLHTRNAVGTIARLSELGVNPASILNEMDGVASQRLVGINCPHCRQKIISPRNSILRPQDLSLLEEGKYSYESIGCDKCFHTGIIGRVPIIEIIKFNNTLRDFFSDSKRGIVEAEIFLRLHGFRSLWDKGMDLVASGQLSLDELCSVMFVDEDLQRLVNKSLAENESGLNTLPEEILSLYRSYAKFVHLDPAEGSDVVVKGKD